MQCYKSGWDGLGMDGSQGGVKYRTPRVLKRILTIDHLSKQKGHLSAKVGDGFRCYVWFRQNHHKTDGFSPPAKCKVQSASFFVALPAYLDFESSP